MQDATVIRTGVPEFVPVLTDEVIEAALPAGERRAMVRKLGPVSAMTVPAAGARADPGSARPGVRRLRLPLRRRRPRVRHRSRHAGGSGLDNAYLRERAEDIARTLQEGLLPARLPRAAGLDLAARYVASGEGAEVGGDVDDLFPLEGAEGFGAALGDVCGRAPRRPR